MIMKETIHLVDFSWIMEKICSKGEIVKSWDQFYIGELNAWIITETGWCQQESPKDDQKGENKTKKI